MKSYSQGMNGQKKFTLLLAKLAKGDLTIGIALTEIEAHWKKMTAIMEMDFVSSMEGWARTSFGECSGVKGQPGLQCASGNHLLKTIDAGRTWVQLHP